MARIKFRQGIVRHQTDQQRNPVFLNRNGNYVDLVVSPDPTIINFIHGDRDYLVTETQSVDEAWGPLPNKTVWLYWDLDTITGQLTRGFIDREPIEQASTPRNRDTSNGSMWFNTVTNKWYERQGSSWREVIRVFACEYTNATTFNSMSQNTPKFTGTQVGLNQSVRSGALIFSKDGKPLRNPGAGGFFTTEDDFITGVPTSSNLRIANQIVIGRANSPLAAYTVVQYEDFGLISAANPALEGQRLFGIIEEDANTNEELSFITEGIVFNEEWDWIAAGAAANTPIYINATGEITLNNSARARRPVGFVYSRQEIFFAPRLYISVTINGGGGVLDPAQLQQINDNTTATVANQNQLTALTTTTIPSLEADIAAAQAATQSIFPLLDGLVSITGDTMTGKLITPLTEESDDDGVLTTKSYVDKYTQGYEATFLSTTWTGTNPKILLIPASVHQLPLNTIYHITVLDGDTNSVVGVQTLIDPVTGLVTITTSGAAFPGVIRIT